MGNIPCIVFLKNEKNMEMTKTNHNNTQNRQENSTEIFHCIAAGAVCL
jgi:hypothetical protein